VGIFIPVTVWGQVVIANVIIVFLTATNPSTSNSNRRLIIQIFRIELSEYQFFRISCSYHASVDTVVDAFRLGLLMCRP